MNEIEKTLTVANGKITVSSRDVARVFEKEHKHVMESIRKIILELSPDFNESNFGLVEYADSKGEKRPAYNLTRDGFTLLVMGYTGTKAMKFKIAYINAFNKMEEALKGYPAIPQTLPDALRLAADLAEKNNALALDNKAKDQLIGELKPKADYTDSILQSKGTVPITAIAKDYGMSGQAFNKLLHEKGVQYKQGDIWFLYSKYQDKGYTHSKSFDYRDSNGNPQTRMTTEWTQKGRLFLYELLKACGILPMIERAEVA